MARLALKEGAPRYCPTNSHPCGCSFLHMMQAQQAWYDSFLAERDLIDDLKQQHAELTQRLAAAEAACMAVGTADDTSSPEPGPVQDAQDTAESCSQLPFKYETRDAECQACMDDASELLGGQHPSLSAIYSAVSDPAATFLTGIHHMPTPPQRPAGTQRRSRLHRPERGSWNSRRPSCTRPWAPHSWRRLPRTWTASCRLHAQRQRKRSANETDSFLRGMSC